MEVPLDGPVRELLDLVPHLEVVHHVPGRIRLRVLPSGYKLVLGSNVEGVVRSIPGIVRMRINVAARSIIIEYNQAQLPYDLWQDVARARHNPELAMEIALRIGAAS